MPDPNFSVIIPCYNEEEAIHDTIRRLRANLGRQDSYEIIVIDDGSTDGTAKLLAQLSTEDLSLRILTHERNMGYGAALKSGIQKSRSDIIVITDADGTYPCEPILDMLTLLNDAEADMVVGSRTGANVSYPFLRRIPKVFLRRYASWIAGKNIPDLNSGLRIFRKSISLRFFNILPDGFSFTTTITLSMITNFYDVRYFPVDYAQRVGRSKIRPIKDTATFLQLIVRTGVYFAPLRVFFPIGLILGTTSILSLFYDLLILHDLTEKTLILLMFFMNTMMFALLADMIDKRSQR